MFKPHNTPDVCKRWHWFHAAGLKTSLALAGPLQAYVCSLFGRWPRALM